MTTLTLKKCSKCGEEKDIEKFSKTCICKSCHNEYRYKWNKNNKEKLLLINRRCKKKRKIKIKADHIKKTKEYRANLAKTYILDKLTKITKYALKNEEITNELIETKRLQITLFRLIKEKSIQQSHPV